jgi:outer membrane protein
MTIRRLAIISSVLLASVGIAIGSQAADLSAKDELPSSAWIIALGGYGVFEPTYLGSRKYDFSFKPQIDFRRSDEKDWLSFPNDAFDVSLYETSNFRAGPAGTISLQSRFHGQDIDLRLGKADVDLQGGAFVEYYPADAIRTRVEVLQGVTGNMGLVVNLSADYIWRPYNDWTLTLGPRAQIVNDQYASDYFSTQYALKNGNKYVPFHAEGGVLSSGAELTGKYDWTRQISTKFFVDFNELMGDAADSPHVNLKGSTEQIIVGVGASYSFAIHP